MEGRRLPVYGKWQLSGGLIESKLKGEGIPCVKKYEGASNYIEIFMGQNTTAPIELYVPEDSLEDAKNIIVPVDLDDCEPIEEN